MANTTMLLALTFNDFEGQNRVGPVGYILAPSLHKIGSSRGKYLWMTFIFRKGLP